MGLYTDVLKHFDDDYDTATGDEFIADGDYLMAVTEASLFESKQGTIFAKLVWQNQDEAAPGHANQLLGLNVPPERLGYTKRDLVKLGYTGRISELEDRVHEFVGIAANCTVVRKDGYVNVRVQDVVGKVEVPVAVGADDDAIPF